MVRLLLFFLVISVLYAEAGAQKWVTKSYEIERLPDETYGTAVDFAGKEQDLLLDVTLPVNDVPPPCGRPLVVLVHGGGFMSGTKNDGYIRSMAEDFARRGYVAATINYRLGMFQTQQSIHCNLPAWDCYNTTDSTEWVRGAYRGMQDLKGAIRYLMTRRTTLLIDPANVFLIGESAGAFITLMAGYLDSENEKPVAAYAMSDAPRPHSTYQSCVDTYMWGTPVANMNLSRPDLGPVAGNLHPGAPPYSIRGVASIYGGMFFNYFNPSPGSYQPPLYLFHQPNDLIVPFNQDRILEGYAECARTGANCSNIINRPEVFGGKGIEFLLGNQQNQGYQIPAFTTDFTNNNSDCLGQVLFPLTTGHAFDNFDLRTSNLAIFFAGFVDDDSDCALTTLAATNQLLVQATPNPFSNYLNVHFEKTMVKTIAMADGLGRIIKKDITPGQTIATESMVPGVYYLIVTTDDGRHISKLIKVAP